VKLFFETVSVMGSPFASLTFGILRDASSDFVLKLSCHGQINS
jgi:hypothetical protein